MEEEVEARKLKSVRRRYGNGQIEVGWEPEYCIHSGRCWRGLPGVFQPMNTPWIKLEGANADVLAAVIESCPTGALTYRRLDGAPQEEPAAETILAPQPNGPLYVRGQLRVVDASGKVIREATRVALCRCGFSANKPFCDQTHERAKFKAE